MSIEITRVDYLNKKHAEDLTFLLQNYALDPMGGGSALAPEVSNKLALELSKRPNAISVIAYIDGKPAGLVNCFEGFSTFNCKPLLNIHDVIVIEAFRGSGLSQKMLQKIEQIGREKACCKLTLEVLDGNHIAKSSYTKFGFSDYELDPKMGKALFWQKKLIET